MQILKPCPCCGETLIFAHAAPQGDIEPAGNGLSRVRCPSCRTEGPLADGFREVCNGWNALSAPPQPAARTDDTPAGLWPIRPGMAAGPYGRQLR